MRYLLRPASRMGTASTAVRTYASDRNAVRYFALLLRNPGFESGQYEVTTFPAPGTGTPRTVATLYKTV